MTDQNSPSAAYIHGTATSERSRLDDLNALTNRSFIDYLNLSAATMVADLGCGPGTLEAEIGARYPGVRLTGIERSESYCATARERTASLPILLLEGALVVGGAGLTIVAARKAGEDPGTLDSSSNRIAGVAAGAGGVLTALAAGALTFDLLSARDSVGYGIRRGRPDQLQTKPCRTRPANESLVTLTLGDGTAVEGITDEAGEVLLAVPAGLPFEAFDLASIAVDGQPWGSLSIVPAPCR